MSFACRRGTGCSRAPTSTLVCMWRIRGAAARVAHLPATAPDATAMANAAATQTVSSDLARPPLAPSRASETPSTSLPAIAPENTKAPRAKRSGCCRAEAPAAAPPTATAAAVAADTAAALKRGPPLMAEMPTVTARTRAADATAAPHTCGAAKADRLPVDAIHAAIRARLAERALAAVRDDVMAVPPVAVSSARTELIAPFLGDHPPIEPCELWWEWRVLIGWCALATTGNWCSIGGDSFSS